MDEMVWIIIGLLSVFEGENIMKSVGGNNENK